MGFHERGSMKGCDLNGFHERGSMKGCDLKGVP